MPKDFYTFLIVPKKNSAAKKIMISSTLLKGVIACFMVIVLATMYTYYDYIKIKREKIELTRLRQLTKDQKTQIDVLAGKVENFAVKMDELRQLDKEVRNLANFEDKQNKGQLLGIGGSPSLGNGVASHLEGDRKMVVASINKNVDQLMGDANDQVRSYGELIKFLKEQKSIHEATPSIWPVKGWVTSEFGNRVSPFGGGREFHKGIDIASRMGLAVVVPADGVVAEAAYDREMGHMVRINHGHGMTTWYGHLTRSVVKEGSMIRRGAVIGYVGNTGRSTGSHVHYSVFLNGIPVNPRKYLN